MEYCSSPNTNINEIIKLLSLDSEAKCHFQMPDNMGRKQPANFYIYETYSSYSYWHGKTNIDVHDREYSNDQSLDSQIHQLLAQECGNRYTRHHPEFLSINEYPNQITLLAF